MEFEISQLISEKSLNIKFRENPSIGSRAGRTDVWRTERHDEAINLFPLAEPGRTPLYVGLVSAWGSVDSDCTFSPHFVGELLNW